MKVSFTGGIIYEPNEGVSIEKESHHMYSFYYIKFQFKIMRRVI